MSDCYTLSFSSIRGFHNFLEKYGYSHELDEFDVIILPTKEGNLIAWEECQKLHIRRADKVHDDEYHKYRIVVKIYPTQTFIEGMLAF